MLELEVGKYSVLAERALFFYPSHINHRYKITSGNNSSAARGNGVCSGTTTETESVPKEVTLFTVNPDQMDGQELMGIICLFAQD